MLEINHLIKGEYTVFSAQEILGRPVDVLLGCDHQTTQVLEKIKIRNVFELAQSGIFNTAKKITDSSEGVINEYTVYGTASGEAISNDLIGKSAIDLVLMDMESLDGIGEIIGKELKLLTGVITIRDLSYWPPFRAALEILNYVSGISDHEDDVDAPSELLPTGRNYATEKRFYNKIYLYDLTDNQALSSKELNNPISLSTMINQPEVFKKPAFGSVLTFEQAWYPQGVSLGQLLHSLALAPAESTRIAIIDWSRSSNVNLSESVTQSEDLGQSILQNRSIAEITEGVLSEFQRGQSMSSSQSSSTSVGASAGFIGIGVSVGHSDTSGTTNSSANSSGQRNVTTDAMQLIKNSTQQNASSIRTKRASVIKETKQEESERIQTRLITNYNHSHALSIHYYEVVQMYRMIVRLDKADRCIFIPLQLVDFNNPAILSRYNKLLAKYILDQKLSSSVGSFIPDSLWQMNGLMNSWETVADQLSLNFRTINHEAGTKGAVINGNTFEIPNDTKLESISVFGATHSFLDQIEYIKTTEIEWVKIITKTETIQIGRESFTDGPVHQSFDEKKINYSGLSKNILSIQLKLTEGSSSTLNKFNLPLKIRFTTNNESIEIGSIWELNNVNTKKTFDLFSVAEKELYLSGEQLNENQLFYSQIIWNNLDPQSIAMLLAPYKYDGKPIITQVDPNPVGIYGNYLILKYFGSIDEKWKKWSNNNIKYDLIEEELVPIPTGGVFAESILGRYNGSEKIDLTRFWNWQDSPIPHMAPEIAPVQAGSRATGEEISGASLQPSLINISNPPALPDPTGMSSLSSLLTASNVFRDMSNAAGTNTLLQQAQQLSSGAAQQLAKTASDNMKIASETAVKLAKIEAGKNMKDSKNAPGAANQSYTGGLINAAKNIDNQNKPAFDTGSNTNSANPSNNNQQQSGDSSFEKRIISELIGNNQSGIGTDETDSEFTTDSEDNQLLSEWDLQTNEEEEEISSEILAEEFSYVPSDLYAGPVAEAPEFKVLKHFMANNQTLSDNTEFMDPFKMRTSFFDPMLNQPFIENTQINNIIEEVKQELPFINLGPNKQLDVWNTSDDSGIRLAVIDITNINQPTLGGWKHMENIHGASIAKLSVVYATYQLDIDVNNTVRGHILNDIEEVQAHMNSFWGISATRAPNLKNIFEWTGSQVKLLPEVEQLLTGNGLNKTFKLYDFLKNSLRMHFMNSVLIASGLFDVSNGGIWHRVNNFYHPQIVKKLADRNVSAASIGLFYTYLAQLKISDPELSAPINLTNGCSWFSYSAGGQGYNEAAKCGILNKGSNDSRSQYSFGYRHESVHWTDSQTNKSFIFVALMKYKSHLNEVHNFRIQVLKRLVEKLTGVHR